MRFGGRLWRPFFLCSSKTGNTFRYGIQEPVSPKKAYGSVVVFSRMYHAAEGSV